MLEVRHKRSDDVAISATDSFMTFIYILAGLLLSSIYPGVPAPRLGLALSGLHAFTDIFPSPDAMTENSGEFSLLS
ncbi:hypothetical protein FBUS_05509 [Fasciolopsis buskii]|uniref:Uncharacterized protein n=1 Tax=Fasciolopsis buskii TaxID=27845 RepID=A0A8E0RZZ0_9TREM|nr:hypothetical protein FBUS_05509 [Fasciolopsis buski]